MIVDSLSKKVVQLESGLLVFVKNSLVVDRGTISVFKFYPALYWITATLSSSVCLRLLFLVLLVLD